MVSESDLIILSKQVSEAEKEIKRLRGMMQDWQERAREIKRRRTEWTDKNLTRVMQDNLLSDIANADLGGAE